MVDVALIELEGVVFETQELRVGAAREAFAALGIDGDARADQVMRDLITVRAERAFSERLAMGGLSMASGARSFLEDASATARLGIVTRARRADVDVMLRLAGLESAFAVIVCGDDVLDAKPAPDGYHLAIDRLTRSRPAARDRTLALENDTAGIRAAHAAQIRCIAIGDIPAHVAIEADAFVPSLEGQSLARLYALTRAGEERVR
jgi:HAD superfamily hydrolase (TIGR01509 family)